MKTFKECYNRILSKGSFDINAGLGINAKLRLSCQDFGEYAKENVESGAKSCCLHFATYLSKLLSENAIYNEIVLTKESAFNPDGTPIFKEDGSQRRDTRASVMYMDESGIICVANPVEDVEMFDRLEIPHEKRTDSQTQKQVFLEKEKLIEKMKAENAIVPLSKDASRIPLEEFIANYATEVGQGTDICTLGDLFSAENAEKSFAKIFGSKEYFSETDILKITDRFSEIMNRISETTNNS